MELVRDTLRRHQVARLRATRTVSLSAAPLQLSLRPWWSGSSPSSRVRGLLRVPRPLTVAAHGAPEEGSAEYWPRAYQLVLEGRTREAERLLAAHSEARRESFQLTLRLLQLKPRLTAAQPLSDFVPQWTYWQAQCGAARDKVSGEEPASPLVPVLAISPATSARSASRPRVSRRIVLLRQRRSWWRRAALAA